jgi:RNA polymerase sigma-54 factor
VNEAALKVSRQLVNDPSLLDLLGHRDFSTICKQIGCDRSELKHAVEVIQSLNPKPGDRFQDNTAGIVIPDVIAYRSSKGITPHWRVRLNESAVPRLTINPVYAEMIRHDRASSMAGQLQEARWVIKNIQQRFDTILRVAQAIALEQQEFFEKGELAMRPLVLRDIAEQCGLHESTVSRVTTHKYMLTPKGTFELKYFFASHVSTDDGGTASSTAIRAKIRQWIADENPKKPLSDQQLADRFNEEGVRVARRTIAKYREALRIEPVSQRKKL